MDKYLRQLITIEFDDKKKFQRFSYWLDWRLILIKNNPVDFIIDGYTILKTKCKGNYQDKDHEFTERVIKLKGLKQVQPK
jgi:hypothetical protein